MSDIFDADDELIPKISVEIIFLNVESEKEKHSYSCQCLI